MLMEATVSSFMPTPAQSCANSIRWIISHWNPPRESTGQECCPLHAQIKLARQLLSVMSKRQCNPLWSPLAGWQCPECACVNGPDADECVCLWRSSCG
jgi:hypothetical protein